MSHAFPAQPLGAAPNQPLSLRSHSPFPLKNTLFGTFDLNVSHISISVSLRLGSDPSGKPMVTVNHCRSYIGHVGISISGDLSWLLNLFQGRIGSSLSSVLEEKICGQVRSSVASYLQPYLQTLQVTVKIDEISSLDYSLLGPPQTTWQNLDVMFKGEFFSNTHRSPIPFNAPALNLPQENNHMVYFGISDYLFNTGSMVYQEAGVMNFSITDDMILTDLGIHLSTNLFKSLIPKLAAAYPNMQMEFQVFPATFPILTFSLGNVTITPKIHVEAFVILPSALLKSVFWLSVTTNVSATVMLTSGRITGSIHSRREDKRMGAGDGTYFAELVSGRARCGTGLDAPAQSPRDPGVIELSGDPAGGNAVSWQPAAGSSLSGAALQSQEGDHGRTGGKE
ncbi:lipopolysaccharide-binding protein-like [Trichosurus vulpecula]|uniref:lipopolysaccharide-binding protein-like n=1 Tax=Trichosurus vulpecula TaxID=9337 RepID=UPI00186B24E2|nr:lipopolysaccharide-binding protein-like [Trichosurus vulpecula]